jgi:hypothetical protein
VVHRSAAVQSFRGAAFARLKGCRTLSAISSLRAYGQMGSMHGVQPRGERGGVWNKYFVVRGIWLRHIVVVFAIGVELHTSAAGQATAALDLPRLAGFAW